MCDSARAKIGINIEGRLAGGVLGSLQKGRQVVSGCLKSLRQDPTVALECEEHWSCVKKKRQLCQPHESDAGAMWDYTAVTADSKGWW